MALNGSNYLASDDSVCSTGFPKGIGKTGKERTISAVATALELLFL